MFKKEQNIILYLALIKFNQFIYHRTRKAVPGRLFMSKRMRHSVGRQPFAPKFNIGAQQCINGWPKWSLRNPGAPFHLGAHNGPKSTDPEKWAPKAKGPAH